MRAVFGFQTQTCGRRTADAREVRFTPAIYLPRMSCSLIPESGSLPR